MIKESKLLVIPGASRSNACEVGKNSNMKDEEIKKLEELLDKHKALYQHLIEEKEIITAENERLNNENVQGAGKDAHT